MANNLYDYLNRFNLGQIGTAGLGAVQGAANFLNKAGIGTRTSIKEPPAPPLNRPVGTQALLSGKPVYWGGNDYGWQQLSGGGTSATLKSLNRAPAEEPKTLASISDPLERAYLEEKSRVSQLAAQNPELQRYEAARKIAAAQNATPEQVQSAEAIGMQMWAKANPELAKRVKPGQSGYDVIQGVINAGAMGAPADLPFNPASLLGTNATQTIPSYAGASDLQPVGTPLPQTQFNTPQNQLQAQMFNRFMSGQGQPAVAPPPTSPAEATYAGATNVQPVGGISLEPFSFSTPAEKRRGELFQQLLNSTLSVQ